MAGGGGNSYMQLDASPAILINSAAQQLPTNILSCKASASCLPANPLASVNRGAFLLDIR